MSNFLEDMAYRQYENKLPERYEEKPLFTCALCGDEIFHGEQIVTLDNCVYCCHCAITSYAIREDFES